MIEHDMPPTPEQLDIQHQVDTLFDESDREALRIITKYFFERRDGHNA